MRFVGILCPLRSLLDLQASLESQVVKDPQDPEVLRGDKEIEGIQADQGILVSRDAGVCLVRKESQALMSRDHQE
ncbi:hypothetical protein PHYPO_G00070390 [Pangasianodon hypophthalmus]|uniref:Uncharacterized protein n=1 Tax=Pangasianodon hypophthalmus TaxID=310915 RepID=A0A5N5LUG5_PANHP|nr:hypothetical protein PHYPO_G00070390 [Pangasianodon hypophthalmus]